MKTTGSAPIQVVKFNGTDEVSSAAYEAADLDSKTCMSTAQAAKDILVWLQDKNHRINQQK